MVTRVLKLPLYADHLVTHTKVKTQKRGMNYEHIYRKSSIEAPGFN